VFQQPTVRVFEVPPHHVNPSLCEELTCLVSTSKTIGSVFGILLEITTVFTCWLHADNKSLLHPDRIKQRLDLFISEARRSRGKNGATNNLRGDKCFWHILRHNKKSQENENCSKTISLALALGAEKEELGQVFSQQKLAALIHENNGRKGQLALQKGKDFLFRLCKTK
jgi:hypothetical protein